MIACPIGKPKIAHFVVNLWPLRPSPISPLVPHVTTPHLHPIAFAVIAFLAPIHFVRLVPKARFFRTAKFAPHVVDPTPSLRHLFPPNPLPPSFQFYYLLAKLPQPWQKQFRQWYLINFKFEQPALIALQQNRPTNLIVHLFTCIFLIQLISELLL